MSTKSMTGCVIRVGSIVFLVTGSANAQDRCSDPGQDCAEPCPAQDACETAAECPQAAICDPSICRPSSCGCNAETGTWTCTRDCIGACTTAPIPNVPAASQWGLLAMTLLVFTAGALVITKRRTSEAG